MGAAVSVASVASASVAPEIDAGQDPVLAVIERHRAAMHEMNLAVDAVDEAQHAAEKASGERRPLGLIGWRDYTDIGGGEIDRARDEFLAAKLAPARVIRNEYRDALERYEAAKRAELDWDWRHGVRPMRQRLEAALEDLRAVERELERTVPTTLPGVSALMDHVIEDLQLFGDGEGWPLQALKGAAGAVAALGLNATAA